MCALVQHRLLKPATDVIKHRNSIILAVFEFENGIGTLWGQGLVRCGVETTQMTPSIFG